MTTSSREDDDRLLEELRAALRAAGEPTDAMTAAAAGAFSWRTVDAELAGLDLAAASPDPVSGSSPDEYVLARANGSDPAVLRFTSGSAIVELEAGDDGWAGLLHPASPGQVSVLGPDGTALETATIDELGAFFIAPMLSGPVRLRCRTGADELLTDWCVLR
ncbi:hypothetical protein JOD57_000945 [Geodermatophilus bullaregiensis]|uniref:hypothetical protein n=1 Tax=Geodermatophilus bullaregiensis TaxID=1564160 RepID=UPI001956C609|nr:hypothetical protein [Geodermatophilus bullaregiensis]MBM7805108.1 hypothetical protein [Geodermatophilus bullaregiensis]